LKIKDLMRSAVRVLKALGATFVPTLSTELETRANDAIEASAEQSDEQLDLDRDRRALFIAEIGRRGGQVAMAKAMDISQGTVSKILNGGAISKKTWVKFETLTTEAGQ
jgi:hypothetical protein